MRLDDAECAYSVEFMCRQLGVSTSGYYDWRNRPDSATAQRREELRFLIKKAFDMSDGTYGYRRVHAQLLRWAVAAGLELVRQLMRELGLVPCQPRPRRWSLTQVAPGPVPDLIRPRLHRRRTRRKARRRYYLYSNRRGVDISGDRHRLLHKRGNRLCHGRPLPDAADI
jgi:helix-turn-helix protein